MYAIHPINAQTKILLMVFLYLIGLMSLSIHLRAYHDGATIGYWSGGSNVLVNKVLYTYCGSNTASMILREGECADSISSGFLLQY